MSASLDIYASGQFQQAVDAAIGGDWKAALPTLRSALKREAPVWAARDGESALPRRRLLAATFALEVGHAVYEGLQKRAGEGPLQGSPDERGHIRQPDSLALPGWSDVEPLVAWASGWLRQQKTNDPLERDWFVAFVQLLRDFHAPDVNARRDADARNYGVSKGHLRDAMDRFPDEPWFGVVLAERGAIAERTLFPGGLPAWVQAPLADLLEMRKELTPLESAPSVRAEVHVHLGCIALICGERDKARAYLDDVASWTMDPCQQYLGHYLHGRADEADERLADAEHAYGSALGVLPDTPSGLTSLAEMLALRGQPAEAATLARRVFSVPPTHLDPMIELWNGTGCTRWPAAIGRLHEGIRPQR